MKTIFTLFTSLILGVAAFAGYHPKTTLVIQSSDQNDIRVVVDGRRFEPNDYHVSIQGLQPGHHTVRIYRERNFGNFTIFSKRYDLVFDNSIHIRPYSKLMIIIDRFGRARMIDSRGRGGRDYDWYNKDLQHDHDLDFGNGRNYGDYGVLDNNSNDRDSQWDIDAHDRDRDGKKDNNDRDHRDGKYDDRDYRDNGYKSGMNDREFNQVLQSISQEWLESNKLKSATQIVTTNSLTSAQVKQLVLLFSFETNKLELAKQAYQNTVDKKNYFMINDAFSFSGSKDELARFIRNPHP
jgi:hypothetical protein